MGLLLSERAKDRVAGAVIRAGGVIVIVLVVAIVVDIGLEALPLFLGASQGPVEEISTASGPPPVLSGSDARREVVWTLGEDGLIRFPTDSALEPLALWPETVAVAAADHELHGLVSAISDQGIAVVGTVRFSDRWSEGARTSEARWRSAAEPLDLGPQRWRGVTANADSDGNLMLAAWTETGALSVASFSADRERWIDVQLPPLGRIRQVAIADGLDSIAVIEHGGQLRVLSGDPLTELAVEGASEPMGAIRFLIGGGTLIAAGQSGTISALLFVPHVTIRTNDSSTLQLEDLKLGPGSEATVPDDQIGAQLASRPEVELVPAQPVCRAVRDLEGMGSPPTVIAPSHRDRGFLVGASSGTVALYHSTSARLLLSDRWSQEAATALAMDPKADGAVAVAGARVLRRSIDNPHPEISFRTLFLPVWYEGYASAKWVWQSTGGSDAFEPKLSLWPLLFGTLKATLYAMLISVPLALAAAVYVSQLAPSWVQSTVKPTLELMAAVPSVVVGFLAALWLAPRLEASLFPSLFAVVSLPLAVILAILLWRVLPRRAQSALPPGGELLILAASAVATVAGAVALAQPLEQWLFAGDFQRFIFTEWGLRYDQRNSLVVGAALGFAVIPVIFTIAEDACSAVPQSLVSAARALGATRWQTAASLVVPAASPGLFAAVMLGLGRAVGETMIVLMAAGNTPLLDLSLFNGMRTMSAAIAVEIPEAPVGGTLFRVLFLTGTLLFAFTLVLTTVADLVGRRLRKRYGRF